MKIIDEDSRRDTSQHLTTCIAHSLASGTTSECVSISTSSSPCPDRISLPDVPGLNQITVPRALGKCGPDSRSSYLNLLWPPNTRRTLGCVDLPCQEQLMASLMRFQRKDDTTYAVQQLIHSVDDTPKTPVHRDLPHWAITTTLHRLVLGAHPPSA
jgi:hypothetical protein